MKKAVIAAGATVLLVLSAAGGASANGQTKTDVCHSHGDGTFDLITVADPAIDSHIAHGDALIGEEVPGDPESIFDEVCNAVPKPPSEALLALAWIDQNANGEYDAEDGLIASLTDTKDGFIRVDTGFTVDYPDTYSNPQWWIPFQDTQHVFPASALLQSATGWGVEEANTERFSWTADASREVYSERRLDVLNSAGPVTRLLDYQASGTLDITNVGVASPSLPDVEYVSESFNAPSTGDDPFIQVSIFPPAA